MRVGHLRRAVYRDSFEQGVTCTFAAVIVLHAALPRAFLVVGDVVGPTVRAHVVQVVGHVHRLHVLERCAERSRQVPLVLEMAPHAGFGLLARDAEGEDPVGDVVGSRDARREHVVAAVRARGGNRALVGDDAGAARGARVAHRGSCRFRSLVLDFPRRVVQELVDGGDVLSFTRLRSSAYRDGAFGFALAERAAARGTFQQAAFHVERQHALAVGALVGDGLGHGCSSLSHDGPPSTNSMPYSRRQGDKGDRPQCHLLPGE